MNPTGYKINFVIPAGPTGPIGPIGPANWLTNSDAK